MENLVTRIGRLISASANSMVSALENAAPEVVMEGAIREVESALAEVKKEMGKAIADKHNATSRLAEENRRHEELSNQAQIALQEKREDLAEAAIAQQMDIEAQIPVLEQAIAEAAEREQELERYISALNAKQREMQQELKRARASKAAAQAATSPHNTSGNSVDDKVSKAEAAFERVTDGLRSGSGSANSEDAAKLAELEELARKNRIQERLAAMKADA